MATDSEWLAREIADLKDQVRALSTARQISRSTIPVVDEGGQSVDMLVPDAVGLGVAAAGEAQKAAEDAQAAFQAAEDALAQAAQAVTTADGKNSVRANQTRPVYEGRVAGDLWYQLDASGRVIGVQIWNGDDYVPYLIVADALLVPGSVGTIALMDGVITTPKLAAGAVTAEKVVITDGANLFQSTYLLTGNGPVGLGNATPYSGSLAAPTGGRLIQLNARDHIADYRVPAKPGDEFYAEVVARRIAGTAALNPRLAAFTASGGIPTGMAGTWNTTLVRGTEMEDLGGGWYRASGIYKVPDAATNAALVSAYVQVDQSAPYTSQWIITDVVLRRRAGGSLIVDGAIDGKTITGALIRTAASGQRMETESNQIRFYDPVNASAGVIRGDRSTNASGDLTWRGVTITDGTYSLGIGYRQDQASGRTVGVYTPNNMRVGGELVAGNVVILTGTETINVRDRLLVYGWTNLTLINGWGTDGTHPRIRRDGDWVTFNGRLRDGTGTQFATLPTWARPGFVQRIPVVNNSGVAAESAWIQVDTTGAIHTGGWTTNVTVARWMVT